MIMSTPEHVYPARLIEKLMNTDVFGKENELNKVPKSTASISDPALRKASRHPLGLFLDFKIVEQPSETRFYEILKIEIDREARRRRAVGGWGWEWVKKILRGRFFFHFFHVLVDVF